MSGAALRIAAAVGGLIASTAVIVLPAIAAEPPRTTAPEKPAGKPAEPLPRRGSSEPDIFARELSFAQDEIVKGNVEAITLQQRAIASIGGMLGKVPQDSWKDAANRKALVKHVLSGGDPRALERLLASNVFADDEKALAEGAVAFARGNRDAAGRHLGAIDPYRQPPSIAGLLALVQAVLISETDPARSLQRIDDARLLSPGTLIEESAWRLAIEIAIASGNRQRFETSALRYVLRFPNSLYAAEMLQRIAWTMGGLDIAADEQGQRLLAALTRQMGPRRLESFYFELGSAALRAGKLQTAKFAGKAARSVPGDGDGTRGRAIELAAMIVRERSPDIAKALEDFDLGKTDPASADLISAARSIDESIIRPPIKAPAASQRSAPSARKDVRDHTAVAVAKLKSKLADADDLLRRSQQ